MRGGRPICIHGPYAYAPPRRSQGAHGRGHPWAPALPRLCAPVRRTRDVRDGDWMRAAVSTVVAGSWDGGGTRRVAPHKSAQAQVLRTAPQPGTRAAQLSTAAVRSHRARAMMVVLLHALAFRSSAARVRIPAPALLESALRGSPSIPLRLTARLAALSRTCCPLRSGELLAAEQRDIPAELARRCACESCRVCTSRVCAESVACELCCRAKI